MCRFLCLAEIIRDPSGNSSTSAGQSLALRGCQMLLQGHAVWMGTWVVVQMISTALKIVKAVAGHQHYTSIIILYLHIFASAQRVGSIVLLRLTLKRSQVFQKKCNNPASILQPGSLKSSHMLSLCKIPWRRFLVSTRCLMWDPGHSFISEAVKE